MDFSPPGSSVHGIFQARVLEWDAVAFSLPHVFSLLRHFTAFLASLVAQLVKNLPAMWGTWVRSLGWEDPLEKGKVTHSSILAMETVRDFILESSKITADGDCSHEIKTLAPSNKSYDQPRQHIKKQRHYFADKGPSSQSYGFSINHVWM